MTAASSARRRSAWGALATAACGLGLLACGGGASPSVDAGQDSVHPDGGGASGLVLWRERKVSKLVGDALDHYEASGLLVRDDQLYVAMDNTFALAIVSADLQSGSLVGRLEGPSQFEAVAGCPGAPSSLCLLEETDGQAMPRGAVVQMAPDGTALATLSTDVAFTDANRGFEGLALVQSPQGERLLALCEGNRCQDDVDSEGFGQIHVLAPSAGALTSVASLAVPMRARFHDFADLAVRLRSDGDYDVAIVSQLSSALWLGRLSTTTWQWAGDGVVYGFPRTSGGLAQYCNVEGVAFLGDNKIAIASDKSDGTPPCNDKDESLSVFLLP